MPIDRFHSPVRTGGARLLTAAALLLLAAPATRAQDRPDPPHAPDAPRAHDARHAPDCRCVGADGEEIEECVCMRTPHIAPRPLVAFEFPGLMEGSFAFQSGARLGVALEAEGSERGAVIEEVVEGSPAEEAGLRAGDVITHFAGIDLTRPIEDEEDERAIVRADEAVRPVLRLTALVRRQEPGDRVAVRYLRDGTSREALAELDDRGRHGFMVAPWMGGDGEDIRIRLGEIQEEMEARMPEIRLRMQEAQGEMREAMERMQEVHRHMPRIEIRDDSLFFFRGDSLVESRPFDVDSAASGVYRFSPGMRGAMRPARRAQMARAPRMDAARMERSARMARAPRMPRAARMASVRDRGIAGLSVVPLTEGLAPYFGTDEGVLVVDVAERSELGVEPGDVILSVDGRSVAGPRELRRALRSHEGEEPIVLRVMRREREVEVEGRIRR